MGNCSSPLRVAIRENDAQEVERILIDAGEGSPDIINEDFTSDCILDSCQKNNNNPLITALQGGTCMNEILELLLKYGGDPNAPGRTFGENSLLKACRQNNIEAVKMILRFDGDIKATDNDGRYAVHCAALSIKSRIQDNVDVLRHLMEEISTPQDVHLLDCFGNTPLHTAVIYENAAAVSYLRSRGADLNAKNKEGKIPADLVKQKSFLQYLQT